MDSTDADSRPEITPTDEQARAIAAIKAWYQDPYHQEFLLDGAAGVGKSTVAGMAVAELKADDSLGCQTVISGAYTAKAALVMRRKGVDGATTVHRMIYVKAEDAEDGQPIFVKNELSRAADANLIVIDEVSMVGKEMANDLRSFGKKILVLGDTQGQLPPIEGAGAFVNRTPDFRLLEFNRFALESPIIRLALLARAGKRLPLCDHGPVQVRRLTTETAELIHREDTQVLCGTHVTRWKATQLMRLRRGFSGPLPLAGEKLICCQNNHQMGLFNGAFATATADAYVPDADSPIIELDVELEDDPAIIPSLRVDSSLFAQHFTGPSGNSEKPKYLKGIEKFDWGSAITVHKAQGSEWPHVTVIDDSGAFRDPDTRRRWLNTALTRAADGLLVLVRY